MAQPNRFLLPDINDLARRKAGGLDGVQRFAALGHRRFELVRNIEMVFDGGLAAPGDKDHLLDSGLARLIDRVLDQRLVDDRQHLLGHRLGRREKPRAEATDRENRLTDGFLVHSDSGFFGLRLRLA